MSERQLRADEQLKDRDVADWIRDQMDAGKLIAMFCLDPDEQDVTMHFLCNPGVQPSPKGCLELIRDAVAAALRNVSQ